MCNCFKRRSHSTSTRSFSFLTSPKFFFLFLSNNWLNFIACGPRKSFLSNVGFILHVFFRVSYPASSQNWDANEYEQINLFRNVPWKPSRFPNTLPNVREHAGIGKSKHNDPKQIAFPSSVNNDIVSNAGNAKLTRRTYDMVITI